MVMTGESLQDLLDTFLERQCVECLLWCHVYEMQEIDDGKWACKEGCAERALAKMWGEEEEQHEEA